MAGFPKVVCLGPSDDFIVENCDGNKAILVSDGVLNAGVTADRTATDRVDSDDRFDIARTGDSNTGELSKLVIANEGWIKVGEAAPVGHEPIQPVFRVRENSSYNASDAAALPTGPPA